MILHHPQTNTGFARKSDRERIAMSRKDIYQVVPLLVHYTVEAEDIKDAYRIWKNEELDLMNYEIDEHLWDEVSNLPLCICDPETGKDATFVDLINEGEIGVQELENELGQTRARADMLSAMVDDLKRDRSNDATPEEVADLLKHWGTFAG